MAGVQARLTIPVLLVTLAVTPPFLLQMTPLDPALGPRGAGRAPQLPPWQVSHTLEPADEMSTCACRAWCTQGLSQPCCSMPGHALQVVQRLHASCMIDGPI